jgi:hypothetical protein
VKSYAKYLKLNLACVIMNATVKRRKNNGKKEKDYLDTKDRQDFLERAKQKSR